MLFPGVARWPGHVVHSPRYRNILTRHPGLEAQLNFPRVSAAQRVLQGFAAQPVLDDEALELWVDLTGDATFAYRGSQQDGGNVVAVDDPNGIPGIHKGLTATSLAAPIWDGARFVRPIHNLGKYKDMGAGTANATGAGLYGSVALPAVDDWAAGFTSNAPMPVNSVGHRAVWLTAPAGETFSIRSEDTGANEGTTEAFTATGAPQIVTCSHTFTAARAGWRSYILRDTGQTCDGMVIHGSWMWRDGDFPMQNIGGFTIDTLPEDLHHGIGLSDRGWENISAGYRNCIPNNMMRGAALGVVGVDGSLPEGMSVVGATETSVNSFDALRGVLEMSITTDNSAGGSPVSPRVLFDNVSNYVNNPITPGQDAMLQMTLEHVSSTGLASGVVRAETIWRDSGNAANGESVGATVAVGETGAMRHLAEAPASTAYVAAQVQVPSAVAAGDTTTVRVRITLPQLIANAVDVDYPIIPTLPGGQDAKAAQPFDLPATVIAPLEDDAYTAGGQSGAVDNDAALTTGAERIVNGTFDSDVANWVAVGNADITWEAGRLRVTQNSVAISARTAQQIVTGLTVGKAYYVRAEAMARSSAVSQAAQLSVRNSTGATVIASKALAGGAFGDMDCVFVATETTHRIDLRWDSSGSTTGDWFEFDSVTFKEYTGAWFSDTGEGRFSINASTGQITLSAGSATEYIAYQASAASYANGDVIRVGTTIACTAGTIEVQAPDGTVLMVIAAGETRSFDDQVTVASGQVLRISAGATGAGTISPPNMKRQQQGAWTLVIAGTMLTHDIAANANVAALSDGTANNRIAIIGDATTEKLTGVVTDAGNPQASGDGSGSAAAVNARRVVAVSAEADDFKVSANGTTDTDGAGTVPDVSRLQVMTAEAGAAVLPFMILDTLILLSRDTTAAEGQSLAPAED